MFKGIQLLKNLQHSSGELSDIYSYHSAKIRNSSLRKGLDLYRTAITKFLGNSIIKKLEDLPAGASDEVIREALKPELPGGKGKWTDLSGLIAPKELVDALLARIENGEVADLAAVDHAFRQMHADYYRLEWTWAYDKYADFFGFPLETITVAQVREIVEKWKEAVIGLDEMLYEDAKKEFNLASMTGFGADGSREEKELDFEQVRGDFESNSFVQAVLEHIRLKRALGDELLARLRA